MINWFKDRQNYIFGMLFVIVVPSLFLSTFLLNSISLQDGFFQVYAKWMHQGLVPYKDFNMIVPPFTMKFYSVLYNYFGSYILPYRIVGFLCKILVFASLYHLFTKFFTERYAAMSTLAGSVIMISFIWDNIAISYHDLVLIVSIFAIVSFMNFKNKMEKGIFSTKQIIMTVLLLFITMLFKQTFGTILCFILFILHNIFIYKYKKLYLLKTNLLFLGSLFTLAIFYIFYLVISGQFFPFFNILFGEGTTAKGNFSHIVFFYLKNLGVGNYIWMIYLFTAILSLFYILNKNYGDKISEKKVTNKIFYSFAFVGSISAILISYFYTKFTYQNIDTVATVYSINKIFMDINTFPTFFVNVGTFYLFFSVIFAKEYNSEQMSKFILFSFIFGVAYSYGVSGSLPNVAYPNLILCYACILNYKIPFNIQKNILIYISIMFFLFLGVKMKCLSPFIWHTWQSSPVFAATEPSKIPILKGIKLQKDEIVALEEIRNISNKYTKSNDKILSYINAPFFYTLLDRDPVTNNPNQYWDICSDGMIEKELKLFNENNPKLIVYMQAPVDAVRFHESLFRNSEFAKQRLFDKKILSLIDSNDYIIAKQYNSRKLEYRKYIKNQNLREYDLLKRKSLEIYKNILEKECTDSGIRVNYSKLYYQLDDYNKRIRKIEEDSIEGIEEPNLNGFIPFGYSLKILVRKDVYDKVNKVK